MRTADCGMSIKRCVKGASENKSIFCTWRLLCTVKMHFCSLNKVFRQWNCQSIGDSANNEGLCPEKP